jgi:hypothetical protein
VGILVVTKEHFLGQFLGGVTRLFTGTGSLVFGCTLRLSSGENLFVDGSRNSAFLVQFSAGTFFLFARYETVFQFKSMALCIVSEGRPCCGLSDAGRSQVEVLSSLRREMIVLAEFSSRITMSSCSFKSRQLGQIVSSTSLSDKFSFSGDSVFPLTAAAIVKDEKGDLVTDCHSILASDVTQTEKHTAEPLMSVPSAFEVEMAIEKIKRHKSPGIDHIPAELVKARGKTI